MLRTAPQAIGEVFLRREMKRRNKKLGAFIGDRVKQRRIELGIPQKKLGVCLGVSHEQIRKYEIGDNKISASMLYSIANVLGVDFYYFFEGFREEKTPIQSKTNTLEKLELVRNFSAIKNERLKRKIRDLVRAVSHCG